MLTGLGIPSATELVDDLRLWIRERGLWWATSVTAHAVILSGTLLVLGSIVTPRDEDTAPAFDATMETVTPDPEIEHFELGESPEQPTELSTDTLMMPTPTLTEQVNTTEADPFEEAGGGSGASSVNFGGGAGFEIKGLGSGPAVKGMGGLGGQGSGAKAGSGGKGDGFGSRGSGVRKAMLGNGGTKASERAVAAALNWLARHQSPDGSWSLADYAKQCKDPTCTGKASASADAGATALALLPYLAAGQTHKKSGPYRKNIYAGIYWLIRHQKPDGNLAAGTAQTMYSHGLATICLCEAYGLTGDASVGGPAKAGVDFIIKAQNPQNGGWYYEPLGIGDTSVVGWQVMALKSALMAGLEVPSTTLEGAQKWYRTVATGPDTGLYSYQPGVVPFTLHATSAAGMLNLQYLGMGRDEPAMKNGVAFLMANLPDLSFRNIYYWYYATQVMHNLPGNDWDTWNRKMRNLLIATQEKKGCAEGSWNPDQPVKDLLSEYGGRLYVTCLSTLTLEVYYRYLPLYKLDDQPKAAKK